MTSTRHILALALLGAVACGDVPSGAPEVEITPVPLERPRPDDHVDATRPPLHDPPPGEAPDTLDPDAGDFTADLAAGDSHTISLDLRAGEVLWWRVTTVDGEPVRSALVHRASRSVRLLDADLGARGAFIAFDDTHAIEVFAPDAASTYRLETWTEPLTTAPLPTNGHVESDLADGAPRGWSVTTHQHRVLEAEVLSQRAPVDSDLDATLSVWDPIARRVIAFADDINRAEDALDPALRADVEHARSYVLVVDMYARPRRAPMTLIVDLHDDAPESPRALDAGVTLDGVIDAGARDVPDTDYFIAWLSPGSTLRVEVSSSGPLEPSLQAWAARGQWVELVDESLPCGPTAALELHHPASSQAPGYYYVLVDDARNLDGASQGGPSFRYDIRATQRDWTEPDAALPLDESLTCGQGSWTWRQLTAPPEHLLFIDTDASSRIAARDARDELIALSPGAVIHTDRGGALTLGVRHTDACGGTSELVADAVPLAHAEQLTRLAESLANHAPTTAQRLEVPARVSAATQPGHPAPPLDHFVVHARAGERILAYTRENPDAPMIDPAQPELGLEHADTILHLIAPDGTPLAQNDDIPGAPSGHYSAASALAPADGDYMIVVAPYFADRYGFYRHGAYDLVVDVLAR